MSPYAILRFLFRWACDPLSLAGYETSCINRFHLASYVWLYYLSATVLDAFHIRPRQSLRFCSIVGVEPTVKCLKGIRITIMLYQPTAMSCLSCWIRFWHTQYNSPHTFCLASYSVMLHDQCSNVSQRAPPTIYIAYELLGATLRTNTLPFLIPTDWLVLYGSQHHLLLFTHPGSLAGQSIRILSHTSALLLHPPVLSVNAASRQWAGLFTWTIAGASM